MTIRTALLAIALLCGGITTASAQLSSSVDQSLVRERAMEEMRRGNFTPLRNYYTERRNFTMELLRQHAREEADARTSAIPQNEEIAELSRLVGNLLQLQLASHEANLGALSLANRQYREAAGHYALAVLLHPAEMSYRRLLSEASRMASR